VLLGIVPNLQQQPVGHGTTPPANATARKGPIFPAGVAPVFGHSAGLNQCGGPALPVMASPGLPPNRGGCGSPHRKLASRPRGRRFRLWTPRVRPLSTPSGRFEQRVRCRKCDTGAADGSATGGHLSSREVRPAFPLHRRGDARTPPYEPRLDQSWPGRRGKPRGHTWALAGRARCGL
jgi:hypothetical protein